MRRTRWALLCLCMLLLVLQAAVIWGTSETAERVEAPGPMEEIWALEDERKEAETPLVTALYNGKSPLAWDRESRTFYCTVGLGDDWDVELTAHARGTHLRYVDGLPENRADAVRYGDTFQIFAWNDESYEYIDVVFTGLPLVSLSLDEEKLSRQDQEARASFSFPDADPVDSSIAIHLRGGVSIQDEKKNYRIDFLRSAEKKNRVEIPGFGLTDTMILGAINHDASMVRDRLGWNLYARLYPGTEPFGARKSAYCEVFVNDRYDGIYLMLEPMSAKTELAKTGAGGDSVYRVKSSFFLNRSKPLLDMPISQAVTFVCSYSPDEDVFAALEDMIDMESMDDETYAEQALSHLDLENLFRYDLFVQAGGMSDNIYNNLFIWAHPSVQTSYRFSAWDLDTGWGSQSEENKSFFEEYWVGFTLCDRVLNLLPSTRARFREIWQEMRTLGFDADTVNELAEGYASELVDSGAWARNVARWGGEDEPPISSIEDFASFRFDFLDGVIDDLAETEGKVPYLTRLRYGRRGISVYASELDEEMSGSSWPEEEASDES